MGFLMARRAEDNRILGSVIKEKKKSIHKTKKKLTRPAKRTRSKAPAQKRKPVRRQSQTAGVIAVEVTEVEVIGGIKQDSVDGTEATVSDPQDEHFPPEHEGSE
jgi:hypothetical protein